ncbi:MAG TPA: two-component regulator propeller domain-containing protein [Bryobacteraceae bacterium]|nr:two-component regulator propeller domain-containing protein [Bryobacteraceae bacterium]
MAVVAAYIQMILAPERHWRCIWRLFCTLPFVSATMVFGADEVQIIRPRVVSVPARLTEGRGIAFHRLPSTAELSQTRVAQISQDADGFLWFGTQSGLNRYDGYKFKVFKHDPRQPQSLSGVFLYGLFRDASGGIWAGSDQYLDRFDPATETFHRVPISDRGAKAVLFSNIGQDHTGALWLPTSDGLYGLNPSNNRVVHYRHNPSDPASLHQDEVQTVQEDSFGAFWVGMAGGFDIFDRQSGRVRQRIDLGNTGYSVWFHEDRFQRFWVRDGNGSLGVLDRRNNVLTRYAFDRAVGSPESRVEIQGMLEDRDGTMWFATPNRGILKYDREHDTFVSYTSQASDPESLPENRVITLFEDQEGNIWVGLHQSAPVFFSPRPPSFEKFTYQAGNPNSLGSALVSVIHEDSDRYLWIGADRLIKRVNRNTGQYSTFDQITGHEVLSIVDQGPDVMWMGTGGLGLKRYDRRTGQIKTWLASGKPSELCSNFVEKLLMDRKNRLWEAAWGGLCYLDPVTGRFTSFPDLSAYRTYHAIAEDRDGMIWVGSGVGLQRVDPSTGRATQYVHSDDPSSVSDNRINSIYQAQDGTLWIGTQNGLDRFDPKTQRFAHVSDQNGLAGNVVSCILEDDHRRLWLSTNAGISSYNPSDQTVNNYSAADGLPGPDLTGWGACFKSQSGEMFFGGFSGAAAFYPDRLTESLHTPPIALTGFQLFGSPVEPGKGSPLRQSIGRSTTLDLSSAQNIFSIEFSALSYRDPPSNRYRHKLEPLEPQWVETGADQHRASYTTLPPGDYTFRAQGATNRGSWSEPGVLLHIRVLPPWWATWWFRTAAAVGLAGLLLALYLLRTRQLSARMHGRIREQERIQDVLRASERDLSLIINTIPAMAWSARIDGTAEFLNHQYLDYVGMSLEQAVNWGWIAAVHRDDRPRLEEYWKGLVASEQAGEAEARLRRFDGAYRWFLFRASPLRDDSGKVVRWYGTNADIQAHKEGAEELQRAIEASKESERDLRLMIETIPGLAWCAAPNGELNYLNRRLLEYTGAALTDWSKGGWAKFLHPNDVEPVVSAWWSALSSGKMNELQCRLRRHDGVFRWFQMFGQAALDGQGAVIRWYGLLLDIDDRKNMEEALRDTQTRLTKASQTATVGEFAAAIAHEINQPLAAVVANGHACLRWLAADPPGMAKANEAAQRIVRDGKEAGEVVRRIRSLFRQTQVERSPVDVNGVITDVIHLLNRETTGKGVSVETELAAGLTPVVADAVQLQQVVFNLLTNAVEAMHAVRQGSKKIFIRTSQTSPGEILVEVRDSGPGLPDPERIFDAFFTTKETGMGMGLAICRSIISAHHGRLWAESTSGSGTKFSFTLPIEAAAAA